MAFNKKKTKIVCTMGPATEDEEVLRQLILHGMNVARFNFSHGSHEYHRKNIERVRSLSRELAIPVAIMLDTKGPEVRTGLLTDGEKVTLETGKTCIVTTDDDVVGTAERFSLDYKTLPQEVEKGTVILIDDGLIGLEVDHVDGTDIYCTITNGGELGEHKGVNFPNLNINLPSVTPQDRADIMFGCELGIDAIAASFIRDGKAVEEIRHICIEMGTPDVLIFPKIESALGVKNFDEILHVSDGCMVARGDLGVEVPAAQVPHIQKTIIKKCKQHYKPVITATQMLDSMQRNPRPTRAEVNDVANAIYDGTDCVMLSGETAAGKYPIEAVKTMSVPSGAQGVLRPRRRAQRQRRHRLCRARDGRPRERQVHPRPHQLRPLRAPHLHVPPEDAALCHLAARADHPPHLLLLGRLCVPHHRAGIPLEHALRRAAHRQAQRAR